MLGWIDLLIRHTVITYIFLDCVINKILIRKEEKNEKNS